MCAPRRFGCGTTVWQRAGRRDAGGLMEFRSRIVPGVLVGGLVLAGGGTVIAAVGGSSSPGSAAKAQYCPPTSPQGGQPQGGPGNDCGNPPETCPNGQPKPPSGNCGNTARG